MVRAKVLLLLASCFSLGIAEPAIDSAPVPLAWQIEAQVQHVARTTPLWPGFEPLGIPLAIYDGEGTWLFRHPSPPEGFERREHGGEAAWYQAGRYAAVVANTSAEIGGVVSGTLLADRYAGQESAEPGLARRLAAVALHETFHVFQRARHPHWQGNEPDLFLYPMADSALLAQRRLETEALRRGLAAEKPADRACWAAQALEQRRARYAGLAPALATYERQTELNEGLAAYVQYLAGDKAVQLLPEAGFPPEQVRLRIYSTGLAVAVLLDALSPGWQLRLEADDSLFLDTLLAQAVLARTMAAEPLEDGAVKTCTFSTAELSAAGTRARQDAEALVAARRQQRQEFEEAPGWRLVIEAADGAPLWPQGFDPWNVVMVDGGVLHTRMLQLGNDSGRLELLGAAALTEAAGSHPLFEGVRRFVLTGLAQEPVLETAGGKVSFQLPHLTGEFAGAAVERQGQEIRLRLGAAETAPPPEPGT